jgi:mannose-1-phosphate guanylyltransferase
MKAMILAAGKGTRVRPLTTVMPKPMLPLIKKPVMECIIEHLKRHGFNQLVINTSYMSDAIEQYFKNGSQWGIDIAFSFEGELVDGRIIDQPLGSAGGMRKIQDFSNFFNETFVVVCGDALIDVDFAEVLKFHRERGSIATIVMKDVPRDEVSKYGVVVTDEHGKIQRFQEKPSAQDAASTTINTGIYVFEPEIFDFIPPDVEYDIGSQLFPKLVEAGAPFFGMSLPFTWIDIGSLKDFWLANRMILSGEVQGFSMPGSEVRPGVWCGLNVKANFDQINIRPPVFIGSSSEIGDGSTILGPTLIGSNCQIGGGANIIESMISDYTRVDGMAHIEESIILAGQCINPDGSVINLEDAGLDWLIDDSRKKEVMDEETAALRRLLFEQQAQDSLQG